MMTILLRISFFALKILLIFGSLVETSNWAHARLGGDFGSIEADRVALQGAPLLDRSRHDLLGGQSHSDDSLYTVHEITTHSGTIREYLSRAGVVFAITWVGSRHPDLSVLFGDYHHEYRRAYRDHHDRIEQEGKLGGHRGSRHEAIEANHIRVSMSGGFKLRLGKAFVPALVPAGVNPDDLR